MKRAMMLGAFAFLLVLGRVYAQTDLSTALGAGPLPSCNDGAAKRAITEFVKTTTEKGSPNFVALAMLELHDDAKREFAYGPAQGLPNTKVSTFTQALYDEAKKKGWTVISMKNDW